MNTVKSASYLMLAGMLSVAPLSAVSVNPMRWFRCAKPSRYEVFKGHVKDIAVSAKSLVSRYPKMSLAVGAGLAVAGVAVSQNQQKVTVKRKPATTKDTIVGSLPAVATVSGLGLMLLSAYCLTKASR